jgi:rod shape-determining protein MreD
MALVWLSGLVVDGLLAEPLGLNGAIFATIAFYLMRFRDRLALQTLLQRMVMIFLMVFIAEVFRAFVLNLLYGQPWVLQPLTVALTSMLAWPIYARLSDRTSFGVRGS